MAELLSPVAGPIEDYALIGDCTTGALVRRDGSIDWLCWPRFDSSACFAALLGNHENGHWSIGPAGVGPGGPTIERSYRDNSLVLETLFSTPDGEVALIDFMPVTAAGEGRFSIVRLVQGRRGNVQMGMQLRLRFDYGSAMPWATRLEGEEGVRAVAGPSMAVLRSAVPLIGRNFAHEADFTVAAGETVAFVLTYAASHLPPPPAFDAVASLAETEAYWSEWSGRCHYMGRYDTAVRRSLLTLKALTYRETGGIVAALTTSLPEQPGGVRNWDYRFCWLRDATLVLQSFMHTGYYDEAQAWSDWLHRSVAGTASQVQIMYGLSGERRLEEWEVPWLDGYQGAKPVRIGNAAAGQLQLDVFGEVLDALHAARSGGLEPGPDSWGLQCELIAYLETVWHLPDEGIWEVRGGRRHFTFSKIMAWVAFDRAVQSAERWKLDAPIERWRGIRDEIHALVCEKGFDAGQNSFVQSFGSPALDASLLLVAGVGFLPPDDPRVAGTVDAIARTLVKDGFVMRYLTEAGADGLPPGEGAFLACSFWLADAYAQLGRLEEGRALFERLVSCSNDLGLLAEEYEPTTHRQLGNFPQAFSHTALIRSAVILAAAEAMQSLPAAAAASD